MISRLNLAKCKQLYRKMLDLNMTDLILLAHLQVFIKIGGNPELTPN